MKLQTFIKQLEEKNAKGYLVGGAVRDKWLGKIPKDYDYCVTGISRKDFEALFPYAKMNGPKRIVIINGIKKEIEFPVYRMEIQGEVCEISLGRKDVQFGDSHNDVYAIPDPNMSIEDDLARRDITINSMAIDLHTGELIDPYSGKEDLAKGIIRKTTDAFKEDPLRVYRAARFASQFGFMIEKNTLKDMGVLKNKLHALKVERVVGETNKALLSDNPSIYFRNLKTVNILDVHFPEINVLSEYPQSPEHHPEGDVFEHVMQVLEAARVFAKNMPDVENESLEQRGRRELMVMYSALLHDVGKAVTKGIHKTKGTPTYIKHEAAGVPIAEAFLDRLHLQGLKKPVLFGVAKHMIMHKDIGIMKTTKVVDFIEGKFEPRSLKNDEKIMAEDWLKEKKKNVKEHIGKMKVFERAQGLINTMGIEEYIALCAADVAGRIRDSEKLPQVLDVFLQFFKISKESNSQQLDVIGNRLFDIIVNPEEAEKLKNELYIVTKHKEFLEEYSKKTKEVKILVNKEELATPHKGYFVMSPKGKSFSFHDSKDIDLGYQIHAKKKEIRTKIVEEIRTKSEKKVKI